jgi:hypothetical protein
MSPRGPNVATPPEQPFNGASARPKLEQNSNTFTQHYHCDRPLVGVLPFVALAIGLTTLLMAAAR